MNAIETTNLTKYYGKARGIIRLNLQVKEGDFFGFIGPNGAGKSTTIRTLCGLISPSEGSAKVFGYDIVKNKNDVLKQIGYLPSEAVFYSGMKVSEILEFSADLRQVDCSKERKILCDRLQLDTKRKVEDLSFGNRKKVGIVCALQHKPKMLLLDEATSGLDPLMQREFFEIICERNEQGTTIFLSSHILSEIQKYCKRASIIRDGKIVACDSVDALANTGIKRISIQGNFDATQLTETKNLIYSNDTTSFLYGGDINKLIAILSKNKIQDLSISEPDLEEVFMHYYTDGGEENDNN